MLIVHISGQFEGRTFDERDVEFNVGETPYNEVIAGIQIALLRFSKDETSK